MIRKTHSFRSEGRTLKTGTLKNFSSDEFLRYLNQQRWENICHCRCQNDTWRIGKKLLIDVIDADARIRSRYLVPIWASAKSHK